MNGRSKHIDVSAVALVDLKAEIARRQIVVKEQAKQLPDGCNVITNLPPDGKSSKLCNWQQRLQHYYQSKKGLKSDITTEEDDADAAAIAEWERTRKTLEAKAKLYEALKAAATSKGKFPAKEDENILVDFERKAYESGSDDDATGPCSGSKRPLASSGRSDDYDDDEYQAASCREEWVQYIDSEGIKRTCMREDLPQHGSQPSDVDDTPLTYAHLREDEVRDHGVGFYGFSKDVDKRAAELTRLQELHRATEEARIKSQQARVKRDAVMGQRLARLRARKGLPDVATAAAQCLGDIASQELVVPADDQSDVRLSNDDLDVASMLRRLRDEAEVRAAALALPSASAQVPQTSNPSNLADISDRTPQPKARAWDRGKSMVSAQQYIQKERNKRYSDFAPPSRY